jgi:hypothetical protein
MLPDNWLVGKDKADKVVKVLFEVAVIFAALPLILPVT